MLKKGRAESIFGNIEEITNLHLPMLYDLDMCLRNWESSNGNIGAIFVKSVRFLFQRDYFLIVKLDGVF
jgi:hypothetical protein